MSEEQPPSELKQQVIETARELAAETSDATPPAAGATPPGAGATPPGKKEPSRSDNPSDNVVQRTRAWTGLWVVVGGDVAIVVAAIWGVVKTSSTATSSSAVVAILTSAFTVVGTMTTAYFGIKSSANTAQSFKPSSDGQHGHAGR